MNRTQNSPPIGGFFELEVPQGPHQVHHEAVALSTGRSCLCAIVRYVRPQRCYVPYYLCDAALDPFRQYGVDVVAYDVKDDLTPAHYPNLGTDELLLYTNHFGIMRKEVDRVVGRYADQVIIDNTHDFFFEGGFAHAWSFTSARKYFGVPDGAYLFLPENVEAFDVVPPETPRFEQISLQHGLQRLLGRQQDGFKLFQEYEAGLPCALYQISEYSRRALTQINLEHARSKRRNNYKILSRALSSTNRLPIDIDHDATPFAYPYLPDQPLDRRTLYDQQIYIQTLWPELVRHDVCDFPVSRRMARDLLPLPIDHRYGSTEMNQIIKAVCSHGS